MKILSIGNSFSRDAHRYIHALARKNGAELETVNLYVANASLDTHIRNYYADRRVYFYDFNGVETDFCVTLKEALSADEYDIVTVQQLSRKSLGTDSFSPSLERLLEIVELYQPRAKIYLHQGWEYSPDSAEAKAVAPAGDMYNSLDVTLSEVMEKYPKISGNIPSHRAVRGAIEAGVERLYRDGVHLSLGGGRYLVALVWYKSLFGAMPEKHLSALDKPIPTPDLEKLISCAQNA